MEVSPYDNRFRARNADHFGYHSLKEQRGAGAGKQASPAIAVRVFRPLEKCYYRRAISGASFLMSSGNVLGDASPFRTPAASPQLHYDLRPLSTGEVLDRTFQVYRSRFVLFAGLALLPTAVRVIASAVQLIYAAHQDVHVHAGATVYRVQIISASLSMVSTLISMVLYGIMQAATTWAVSAVYLGEAASIKAAYGAAFNHWFRYTVVLLRQVWAFLWLPCLLLAAAFTVVYISKRQPHLNWLVILLFVLAFLTIFYGVWAYIRISLAVSAAVVESLKVGAAVERSKQLLASRKVRIFLLLLLLCALYMVVGLIESPLLILIVRSRGVQTFVTQAINLAVSFVAGTLIGPVGAIGLCLFYFDERVRREGFDIEWMMRKLASEPGATAEFPPQAQENSAEPA
jgi:hypothetical protein